jgi:hypothetical protein
MTAPFGEVSGGRAEPVDVLTFDEEGALGRIREIVSGMRSMGSAPQLEEVEKAVTAAGGAVLTDAGEAGSRIYGLSGARFSLSADPGSGGAILLSFVPAPR